MLEDTKPNPLMKQLFVSLAECGLAGTSDLVDEMLRQVQKSKAYEASEPGVVKPLYGHPSLHRMLKDMVKAEVRAVRQSADGDKKKLKFSQSVAKILLKNLEESIKGRGVFILMELVENEETKDLVMKQLKAEKKMMQELVKKGDKSKTKGLQILLKKI